MVSNLDFLADSYPGRFIIVGRSYDSKNIVLTYGVTGRSNPSKARKFEQGIRTEVVRTAVTDDAVLQKGNPALLLYPAIAVYGRGLVASNGTQTELLYSAFTGHRDFSDQFSAEDIIVRAFEQPAYRYDAKEDRWIDITTFEPDAPNNTPRINVVAFGDNACLHIVKEEDGKKKEKFHPFKLESGQARFISTYDGEDKSPLPSFRGDPYIIGLGGTSATETNDMVFAALNPELRVCVTTVYFDGTHLKTSMNSIHDLVV